MMDRTEIQILLVPQSFDLLTCAYRTFRMLAVLKDGALIALLNGTGWYVSWSSNVGHSEEGLQCFIFQMFLWYY